MSCPKVIRVVTPGPPGPPGGGITLTGPAVLGREDLAVGGPVALPLGAGLMIAGGALAVREVSAAAAGLVPAGWVSGATAATLPDIHGSLTGLLHHHVRPVGAPLAALMPYKITGNQGDTDRVQIVAADAGDPQTMPASGILPLALAQNADGRGAIAGDVQGVNTAAYAPGTVLYVAIGGGLTATMPASNAQMVAVVGRQHATTGTVIPLIGPSLARVAYTGVYGDLLGRPAIPATPADIGAATAAQGVKADNAVQPGVLATELAKKADLINGFVPSAQLPGFVDDVVEYANVAAFPATGEAGKLYVSLATNMPYRWSGSQYVEISPSPGSTDAVPEGLLNLYFTGARGQAAAADWWPTASTPVGRTLVAATDVAAQRTALGIPAAVGTPTGVMITAANIATLTSVTLTANRIFYMKIRVDVTSSPTQILCRTNTTYVGASVVQLGIYSSNNNRPQNRIYTSGNVTIDVPTATASANYGAAVSGVTLAPGWYWLAFCAVSTGTTPAMLGGGNNSNGVGAPYVAEFTTSGAAMSGLIEVLGALPATANGGSHGTTIPAVFLVF